MFLRNPDVVQIVIDVILKGVNLGYFRLRAFVLMANHVHLLLLPLIDASKVMRSIKGASAREANKFLNRTGEPFWQKESYDHWVRDDKEFVRIAAYIENNPVRACLAPTPADYLWSSAHPQWKNRLDTNVEAAR